MSKHIEVFTANTYLCEDVIQQVHEMACSKCEVTIYELNREKEAVENIAKAKGYGILTIPAVIMDGKLINHSTFIK